MAGEHLILAGMTLMALMIGPLTVLSRGVQPDQPALAIIPPWRNADKVVSAAGLDRIGPEIAMFGALIPPVNTAQLTALRHAGAWLVLDGSAIALICGVQDV